MTGITNIYTLCLCNNSHAFITFGVLPPTLSLRGRFVRGNPGFEIVGKSKRRRGGITTLWTGLLHSVRNDKGAELKYSGLDCRPPRDGQVLHPQ